jgi:hypothetical protein
MFDYSAPDRATRIGCMIGDAFLVALTIFMIWGLALSR